MVSGQFRLMTSLDAHSSSSLDPADSEFAEPRIVDRVDVDDLTAEVPEQPRDEFADAAGADNASSLASEVEPDQSFEREVAFPTRCTP